ncbi:lycopene beta-cyclase CrtY [Sphingomonas quercus]|uniref:Lycopene beta-cyclase CrtY n=1 Tax=Sphingomonas quercus TaxID=2842451 RepID=A0ABS6BH20_9SPHN|nr:lycopene beta-cyclase CrtY [Sphingomonas quercus]MBU3077479.1 lycopene beta-cyclase CrtY [Sphingomonas quercus]
MRLPLRSDLAIVGGGLAGGLTALALARRRPDLNIVLIEQAGQLGGNHVWSFFASDVEAEDAALLAPLVAHRWEGHDVAFPTLRRTLAGGYRSITSARFDAVLREAIPAARILTGRGVAQVTAEAVALADGSVIAARAVIDARGAGDLGRLDCGWQKFVGQTLRLEAPHGLARPIIMDATVDQSEGYRFVYVLPVAADRLFVEDTYYSDTPELDRDRLAGRIAAYAAARGWRVQAVEHEERGVLPVVMGGDFERYWRSTGDGIAKAGVRAGLFHPTTGYSLPDAVALARHVAALPDPAAPDLPAQLHAFARARWQSRGFYRMLDRMLFRAAPPADRWRVLERFYRLDEGLVARFYAARSTAFDRLRIVAGRPPVPILHAIPAIMGWRR